MDIKVCKDQVDAFGVSLAYYLIPIHRLSEREGLVSLTLPVEIINIFHFISIFNSKKVL